MKPIAMKCSQENWEEIKPILEKYKLNTKNVGYLNSNFCYLVNNDKGNFGEIGNWNNPSHLNHNRIAFEEWNQDVFLEYCEIKEEFVLPEKWCVKARNQEEAKVIAEYANPLNKEKNGRSWSREDSLTYYLLIRKNKYIDGRSSNISEYTEITFEQFKKYVLKQDSENMKKIIGYKLIKPEYLRPIQTIIGTSYSCRFLESLSEKYTIESLKKAGVLDLWFEPIYKSEEKIINIGFDVKVTSEGIFHNSDNITEFVEKMYKEYNSLHSCTFGNYKAKFKDIIWESTGCQNVETKLSDWKKVWETYKEMIK